MKWKSNPCKFLSEKTFLVIKDDDLEIPKDATRTSASGRRTTTKDAANTGTWPPSKMKRVQAFCGQQPERPKTASLERPSVLDPTLVDKLDMSLLSKELLRDSMTRFHRLASKPVGGSTATSSSSLSSSSSSLSSSLSLLPSPTLPAQRRGSAAVTVATTTWPPRNDVPVRRKRRCNEQIYERQIASRMEEADRSRSPVAGNRVEKTSPGAVTHEHAAATKRNSDRKLDDNNNRNGPSKLSTVKKKNTRAGLSGDLEIFTTASAKNLAPEPCKTCGRPDQPERFHSHPKGSQKIKDILTTATTTSTMKKSKVTMPAVPKSIQKPVALNFRSDRNKNKLEDTEARSKPVTPQDHQNSAQDRTSSALNKRGPRSVTCYVCGREFGTASFPIHEPKCLEKWERENNSLPPSQRRPIPQRPVVGTEHSDWNAAAWEQSQEQLVPCAKCGRTFLPERLPVHERSCKATPKNNELKLERLSTSATTRNVMPPTVPCQICGRIFGSRSIKIHEPQCNRRWLAQNGSANPQKNQSAVYKNSQESSPSMYPDLSQKKTITCYICGRDFGTSSIAIHEPQCLKKWHAENDKLSAARRRQVPQKPEIVYAQDPQGNTIIDQTATAEANWMSHLSQLVPCKYCARTFNPDRVNIHENSCKGNR